MNTTVNSLTAVLLISLVAVGVYFLSKDKEPSQEELREAAAFAAEEWIREHSPTFVYDGTNLELREIEKRETRKGEPAGYDIVFDFDSRHAGYGDREGKMLAQVITPHTIEVRVEKKSKSEGWEITHAVTDGVFDEKTGEFLEDAKEEKTRRVDLYFMGVEDGKEEPVSLPREIRIEKDVEKETLEALLEGPTREEKAQDYFTSIPEGVEIEKLEIREGTAYVSFSAEIDENVAGSARVHAIREQIELTLSQFEQIESVEIAVEGQTEGILQP